MLSYTQFSHCSLGTDSEINSSFRKSIGSLRNKAIMSKDTIICPYPLFCNPLIYELTP